MTWPRTVQLPGEARLALLEILGIMSDQLVAGTEHRWRPDVLVELELRLIHADPPTGSDDVTTVRLEIEDAALLLDGMAFTEVASADLPWIDMVRWTSDFVGAELRRYWTDEEWLQVAGR